MPSVLGPAAAEIFQRNSYKGKKAQGTEVDEPGLLHQGLRKGGVVGFGVYWVHRPPSPCCVLVVASVAGESFAVPFPTGLQPERYYFLQVFEWFC